MKLGRGLILILIGAILFVAPTIASTLGIVQDEVNFDVYVVDRTTNQGVAGADVYVFESGGSTLVSPELADYTQKTNSAGHAYFVLETGFYRFCVNAEGYTSDWSNSIYTVGGASGVSPAVTSYRIEVYRGELQSGDVLQYPDVVLSTLQIVGIVVAAAGVIVEIRDRKVKRR